MKNWNCSKTFVFLLLAIMSQQVYGRVAINSPVPELVRKSSLIARGTISIRNEKAILQIERILKGEVYPELTIQYRPWLDIPVPSFQNEETVLLFLETPDANGTAYLVGYGDQAKWPKSYTEGPNSKYYSYPKILATASLEDIQEVIAILLQIENIPDINEKVALCAEHIKSSNPLLQLTTLQYVMTGLLWPISEDPYPRVPHNIAEKRFGILRKLSSDAMPLINSNEPLVRAECIQLLRYHLSPEVTRSIIGKITDGDAVVRATAGTVLKTLCAELKIKGTLADYKTNDTADRLKSIQQQWNGWLDENIERVESMEQQEDMMTLRAMPVVTDDKEQDKAYMEVVNRIKDLSRPMSLSRLSKEEKLDNLGKLERLGEEIGQRWRESDVETYALATLKLSAYMVSVDFGAKKRQHGRASAFTMRVLQNADKIPLELECRLLGFMQHRFDAQGNKLQGTALAELRKQQTKLRLHAWQRVEKMIDKNWDPNAIPADRKKSERNRRQRQAHDLKKYRLPGVEKAIIRAYIEPPKATDELGKLLKKHGIASEISKVILDAVEKKEIPKHLKIGTTQPSKQ